MATARKLGGYAWRQAINRAQRANSRAVQAMAAMLRDPGPRAMALHLAQVAQSLAVVMESLSELERIGRE